ncbi:hypothetical protein SAMN04488065_2937 [Haloplanus vescus]|uniref:Uncharacterized protein n=1 Tax=Haloplanus vescus TaxID=555874 RepID=A0A1H4AV21_9EURY|nr:hypothetical protein [Haloplanus vescus]SEA39700.1 hypothetical protein SAMN04488065_2937 [Haloplanus vescus]
MPISNDEFEAGTVETSGADPISNDEEGPIETEKDLITSFLSERPDTAFTEREIVLGADFTPALMNQTQNPLGKLADGLINLAGNVTATTMVIDDVDEALDELVEEGIVSTKEIETGDGSVVFYRIA